MSARSQLPVLGRYADPKGRLREIFARPGSAGSLLVIDRDAQTLGDRRLVAHLAADEPNGNAALACRDYLRQPHRRCRSVEPEDLTVAPLLEDHPDGPKDMEELECEHAELRDRHGHAYRLTQVSRNTAIPELRWYRLPVEGRRDALGVVRVREAIAALESYEPVRDLTARALLRYRSDSQVSTHTLRAELERLNASNIVLNRGLREAVLAAVGTQRLTMSEITIRCGRLKRGPRGGKSGDTSWLGRRIGLLPEGGRGTPTPWVHSDVLALIARHGLDISPHEVELG